MEICVLKDYKGIDFFSMLFRCLRKQVSVRFQRFSLEKSPNLWIIKNSQSRKMKVTFRSTYTLTEVIAVYYKLSMNRVVRELNVKRRET